MSKLQKIFGLESKFYSTSSNTNIINIVKNSKAKKSNKLYPTFNHSQTVQPLLSVSTPPYPKDTYFRIKITDTSTPIAKKLLEYKNENNLLLSEVIRKELEKEMSWWVNVSSKIESFRECIRSILLLAKKYSLSIAYVPIGFLHTYITKPVQDDKIVYVGFIYNQNVFILPTIFTNDFSLVKYLYQNSGKSKSLSSFLELPPELDLDDYCILHTTNYYKKLFTHYYIPLFKKSLLKDYQFDFANWRLFIP